MKRLSYFFVAFLIMFSTNSMAQKYHATDYDDLKGPVKSCTWSMGGGTETRTYTEDGKYDFIPNYSNPVYNDNGYIISIDVELMGLKGKETAYYNSKKQVVKVVQTFDKGVYVIEFKYNSDGTMAKRIETATAQGISQTITYTYTYEAFDSHGNWTRGTVRVGNQVGQQTRAITYW